MRITDRRVVHEENAGLEGRIWLRDRGKEVEGTCSYWDGRGGGNITEGR